MKIYIEDDRLCIETESEDEVEFMKNNCASVSYSSYPYREYALVLTASVPKIEDDSNANILFMSDKWYLTED